MPKPSTASPSKPCEKDARGASVGPKPTPQPDGPEPAKAVIDLDAWLDNSQADGLDELSFRHFAGLLNASQEYAGHTGFRFHEGSFDGIDDLALALADVTSGGRALERDAGTGSRLAAKLHAMPAVKAFSERLEKGEPELVEELEKAFRIIVAESARNMMIATVKGVGLFPPCPAPEGVSEEDCSYEDASAPLPVIGQRLHNDHVRRLRDDCSSARRRQKRSLTAAFLVDFAHEVGVTLPHIPETYQTLLQEFTVRNSEFNAQHFGSPRSAVPSCDSVALEHEVSDKAVSESPVKAGAGESGWLQRWHTALWPSAGITAVSEAQKAPAQRRERGTGCA